MPVVLIRHGDALPARDLDATRILSLRGREETAEVGRELRDRGLAPALLITSPLVRAVQTAEILASVLEHPGVVDVEPALVPDGDAIAAERLLREPEGLVIAVTHEPIVRVIAARLSGQSSAAPFATSTACMIDQGKVLFRITPRG